MMVRVRVRACACVRAATCTVCSMEQVLLRPPRVSETCYSELINSGQSPFAANPQKLTSDVLKPSDASLFVQW